MDRKVELSADEVLDCGKSRGCKGGEAIKTLNFGKRRGFVEKSCYERTDGVCPEENFET